MEAERIDCILNPVFTVWWYNTMQQLVSTILSLGLVGQEQVTPRSEVYKTLHVHVQLYIANEGIVWENEKMCNW